MEGVSCGEDQQLLLLVGGTEDVLVHHDVLHAAHHVDHCVAHYHCCLCEVPCEDQSEGHHDYVVLHVDPHVDRNVVHHVAHHAAPSEDPNVGQNGDPSVGQSDEDRGVGHELDVGHDEGPELGDGQGDTESGEGPCGGEDLLGEAGGAHWDGVVGGLGDVDQEGHDGDGGDDDDDMEH